MQSIPYSLTLRPKIFVFTVMGTYAALAPIAVSSVFQHLLAIPMSVLLTMVSVCIFAVAWIMQREETSFKALNRIGISMILAITLPAFLSIAASIYALTVVQSVEYVAYFQHSLLNRLINIGMFATLSLLILFFIQKDVRKVTYSLTQGYFVGLSVLVVGGIWQFLHFTIGYPMPGFETRAFVHSVSEDVLINFRLTSFTDEPSFLVPFLIDGLIIGGMLLSKKVYSLYAIPAVLVLLLSFSVSGYVNLAVIVFSATILLFARGIIPKKVGLYVIISILILGMITVLTFPQLITALFMPIIGRLDSLFDVMHHSRLYMLVFPFVWLFDYSSINALFGFGPGSYDFLARTKYLSHQGAVSGTSNNAFVDLLFEHGVFGGLIFTCVFIGVFVYLWRKRKGHLYNSIALLLWIHLGLTNMYRSDFASPRFWIIVLIVIGMTELAKRNITLSDRRSSPSFKKKVTT